jgi:hypothetical protein
MGRIMERQTTVETGIKGVMLPAGSTDISLSMAIRGEID